MAFDGSPKAYEAFDHALKLATVSRFEPEIIVLSVVQIPEPIDIVEMDAIVDAGAEHYKELFEELKIKAKEQDIEIKTEVAIGHPAEEIVKYAAEHEIDHIVIGQRGKSKVKEWLLGSVSKRVASYAPCDVIIIK